MTTSLLSTDPVAYAIPASGVLPASPSWASGPTFAVPTSLKKVSFVLSYTGGGSTSKLGWRLRVGHTPSTMGYYPTPLSTPGDNTGATPYNQPITFDNSQGFGFIALEVQDAVADGAGPGTVTAATIAGHY